MKVLSHAKGERVIVNGDISVEVLEVRGDEVLLGVVVPEWMSVEEQEEEADAASFPLN
jgi:carbon storage regulator CsrA